MNAWDKAIWEAILIGKLLNLKDFDMQKGFDNEAFKIWTV